MQAWSKELWEEPHTALRPQVLEFWAVYAPDTSTQDGPVDLGGNEIGRMNSVS